MKESILKSKLASYSALTSSLLAFGKVADAQIVYHDFIPEILHVNLYIIII